jgi:hypothetical protein
MVRVTEKNFSTEREEILVCHTLHSASGSHRHEDGGLEIARERLENATSP